MPRRPFGSAVEKLEFTWHAEVGEAMRVSSIEVQLAGLVSSIEVSLAALAWDTDVEEAIGEVYYHHLILLLISVNMFTTDITTRLERRGGAGDMRSLLPTPGPGCHPAPRLSVQESGAAVLTLGQL